VPDGRMPGDAWALRRTVEEGGLWQTLSSGPTR
jgi:hypothetical protein